MGLEALLVEMFRAVGMKRGLKRFVATRNLVFHEGTVGKKFQAIAKKRFKVRDLLEEYLLRLLGYAGPYQPYSLRPERALS